MQKFPISSYFTQNRNFQSCKNFKTQSIEFQSNDVVSSQFCRDIKILQKKNWNKVKRYLYEFSNSSDWKIYFDWRFQKKNKIFDSLNRNFERFNFHLSDFLNFQFFRLTLFLFFFFLVYLLLQILFHNIIRAINFLAYTVHTLLLSELKKKEKNNVGHWPVNYDEFLL